MTGSALAKFKSADALQIVALAMFVSSALAFQCTPGSYACDGNGPVENNPGYWDWWVDGDYCDEQGQWWIGAYGDTGSADNEEDAQAELDASLWNCEWGFTH